MLLLVRHGESTWNAEGRLQGQADPPLSERGRAQVRALAAAVGALGPQRAVTSDLVRARDTATLLGFPDAEPDPRWRELDMGAWAGSLVADARAGDEAAYALWRAGEGGPPGGESFAQLTARVRAAAEEALADGRRTLVVSHGGAIRAALLALLGLGRTRIAAPGNGTLTVVEPGRDGPRLTAYNAGPHGPGAVQREA